jgi:hypothetical protein
MKEAGGISGYSRSAKAWVSAIALASLAIGSTTAGAITVGQVDDFEDGTTQGWTRPDPPLGMVNVATGGPAGAGDSYLQITEGGGGGRLLSNNVTQWTGDWLTAGVIEIVMDVNNLGTTDLSLRLGIDSGGFGDNTGAFATNYVIPLAASSGWQTVSFSVTPTDWVGAGGGGATEGTDISATLSNVALFRIYSNPDLTDYRGEKITGTLGVDNITAVPLPAAVWLFASGLLGLIGIAKRKKSA